MPGRKLVATRYARYLHMTLALCFPLRQTNKQTDGRTDRQTDDEIGQLNLRGKKKKKMLEEELGYNESNLSLSVGHSIFHYIAIVQHKQPLRSMCGR